MKHSVSHSRLTRNLMSQRVVDFVSKRLKNEAEVDSIVKVEL